MIKTQIKETKDKSKAVITTAGRDVFEIIKLLKNRKFEGNRGLAVRNSIYQFSTNIVLKGGALLFTLIFARILLPELFGLYSLALSTIVIFSAFTDLGIGSTVIVFVSRALHRNKKKEARAYFSYLLKLKIVLVFVSAIVLLLVSKLIANNYYHKPLLLALVAGSIYTLCINFIGIYESLFQSANNFKRLFYRESLFQVLRLIIVPLVTIYALKRYSSETVLFIIILALAISYLIALIFIVTAAYKDLDFLKGEKTKLTPSQKKSINKFLFLMSATVLSGFFIGYVDTVMLGHFVASQYIGFYQAALNILNSLAPLIPFSAVLFPIFSRIKGRQLERGLKRSAKLTFLLSVGLFCVTFFFAPLVIRIIYGASYANSVEILRVLSFAVLVVPVSALYDSYFTSQGKPLVIAKFLIISTIINIILNYLFITFLISHSEYLATLGSGVAVVITRASYFGMQLLEKRKLKKQA